LDPHKTPWIFPKALLWKLYTLSIITYHKGEMLPPCIRGLRVTVGTVVGLMASGHSPEKILQPYPYLELEDIYEALAYAAWRSEEIEVPLQSA
jgi:uncharacterized protein (DUF433 family)